LPAFGQARGLWETTRLIGGKCKRRKARSKRLFKLSFFNASTPQGEKAEKTDKLK